MRILILGSDGQIGRPLTNYLINEKHHVIEFDNNSNPITDLRIPNILDCILLNVDFVFFLAFDVGGSHYLNKYQNTYEFISNNIKIMNNTFDSLRKHNTPFIFASSQMSNMSYSSYGILKHIGEKYVHNLNGKIVKFWNVYGYEENLDKSHVITDFILMAKESNKINIKTSGMESRQFLYTEDCCECLNILMNKFNELDCVEYDISSFEWIKIIDIAKLISNHFNDCEILIGSDYDYVQNDVLNEPKIEILKYWKPKTLLVDGIKKIIEKYNK